MAGAVRRGRKGTGFEAVAGIDWTTGGGGAKFAGEEGGGSHECALDVLQLPRTQGPSAEAGAAVRGGDEGEGEGQAQAATDADSRRVPGHRFQGEAQGSNQAAGGEAQAATNQAAGAMGAPDVARPGPVQEGEWEERGCVICWEGARTHVVVPCGHFVLCGACALRISEASVPCCPVLNFPITFPCIAHCMPDAGPNAGPTSVTGKIRWPRSRAARY